MEGERIDTITLYLNPYNQAKVAEWMLSLRPRRVIFNPGTENPSLQRQFREQGAQVLEACTLVMLSTGSYQQYSQA